MVVRQHAVGWGEGPWVLLTPVKAKWVRVGVYLSRSPLSSFDSIDYFDKKLVLSDTFQSLINGMLNKDPVKRL